MAKKIISVLLILLILFLPTSALAEASIIKSTDLIDKAKEYDGQEVVYTGEIIGDIMQRGDHTWINVNDGSSTIGIWVVNDMLQGISIAGRYETKGDTIKVTGVFYRACAEHGGDLDIHATAITLVQKGTKVTYTTSAWMIASAILLFAGALACSFFVVKKIFMNK